MINFSKNKQITIKRWNKKLDELETLEAQEKQFGYPTQGIQKQQEILTNLLAIINSEDSELRVEESIALEICEMQIITEKALFNSFIQRQSYRLSNLN